MTKKRVGQNKPARRKTSTIARRRTVSRRIGHAVRRLSRR